MRLCDVVKACKEPGNAMPESANNVEIIWKAYWTWASLKGTAALG